MCTRHAHSSGTVFRQMCGGYQRHDVCGGWLDIPNWTSPPPRLYIGRRRFLREAEIVDWLDDQAKGVRPQADLHFKK